MKDYNYILLIDLEATCCNLGSVPRDEMEIIEIGAIIVNKTNLLPIEEFNTFIKPVRHPILSDFCKSLTTITQYDVDVSPLFPEAMQKFNNWVQPYELSGGTLFCSWGAYDKNQFKQDCNFHKIPYPFGDDHLNIKAEFSKIQGRKKQYGMARALELANIPLTGVHHRGIDDVRNMVKLLPYIFGTKKNKI